MWINKKHYYKTLDILGKMLDENHELRKICQCRQCKWGSQSQANAIRCKHDRSYNYNEEMSLYGSCEKCERR